MHGRTKDQKSEPVDLDAIKLIKESVRVPVIANGDICSLDDVERVHRITGADGLLSSSLFSVDWRRRNNPT